MIMKASKIRHNQLDYYQNNVKTLVIVVLSVDRKGYIKYCVTLCESLSECLSASLSGVGLSDCVSVCLSV